MRGDGQFSQRWSHICYEIAMLPYCKITHFKLLQFVLYRLCLLQLGQVLAVVKPHHVRSIVKSVFLLTCLYVCPNPLSG